MDFDDETGRVGATFRVEVLAAPSGAETATRIALWTLARSWRITSAACTCMRICPNAGG